MSASSDELLQRLKKENEELQFELKDLQYLIEVKEEELASLQSAAKQISELQSKLDIKLYEIEQIQQHLDDAQQKSAGALQRENALEEELIQNVAIEKSYYEIKDKYTTTKSALEDVYREMDEAGQLYKEVAQLNKRLAELESSLEIALLDNQFLKEELQQYRQKLSNPNKDSI